MNTTAANLLNIIPSLKLSATDVLRSLHDGVFFNQDNNIHHTNFIKQKQVLEDVLARIKSDADDVVADLYEITRTIATPHNAFIYLASNVENLTGEYGSDLSLLSTLLNRTDDSLSELEERYVVDSEYVYRDETKEKPQHIAFGVGGTESCYLKQSISYNNTDWSKSSVSRVMEDDIA